MKDIVLFQPFLRVHILNFAKAVQGFRFVVKSEKFFATKNFYKKSMSSPAAEFSRSKLGWKNRLRRTFGILNARPKFTREGDLLFTYGCLLFTNKPYCVYIENGAALFNYDPHILRNPLAKLWFAFLVRLPQCKKLIFMSETAKKSLLATGHFSAATERVIEQKSIQVYPYTKAPERPSIKQFSGSLKCLFTGIYYAKGGRELLSAFEAARSQSPHITLTLVTPLHMLLPEDRAHIESVPGVTLYDAAFSPEEMEGLYRTHDVFMFPTFRDTFGLVLIEALSFGMPIIATDQYATTEMAIESWNAFVFPSHPILDYDQKTKEMYGQLYDAKAFYHALFVAEKRGEMHDLEAFLTRSMLSFVEQPFLLEQYSKNSLKLYTEKFHQGIIAKKIQTVFEEALGMPSK